MTDKEIIKALECCWKSMCGECPSSENMDVCRDELMRDALGLSNRQQAEIERVTDSNKRLREGAILLLNNENGIELIIAEAIKEFAETLKEQIGYIEEAHQREYKDDFGKGWMTGFNSAAQLITGAIGYIAEQKEMVGADNG